MVKKKKKKNNGSEILKSDLSASNSYAKSFEILKTDRIATNSCAKSSEILKIDRIASNSCAKSSEAGDDEGLNHEVMGSTGPKGEKKKLLMTDILNSGKFVVNSLQPQKSPEVCGLQSRQLCKSLNSVTGECSSSRFSWADDQELDISLKIFSNNDKTSMKLDSLTNLDKISVNLDRINSDPTTDFLNGENFSPLEKTTKTPIPDPVMAKKSWTSLFAENRKPGNGFSLNYVPPDINDTVTFDEEEWNEGESFWKFSLIGQILGLNAKFKAMENYVQKIWGNLAVPETFLLKPGLFLFKFKNIEDMRKILENGHWFFGSRPILLKPWTIDEELEKRTESVYPIWIQLTGLRLNLWNKKSISKIASIIGKPITTDMLTANRQRLAYARVLVEVNMPSNLLDVITIKGPDGKSFQQKVYYEFKPRWCEICKNVSHDTLHCKKQARVQDDGIQTNVILGQEPIQNQPVLLNSQTPMHTETKQVSRNGVGMNNGHFSNMVNPMQAEQENQTRKSENLNTGKVTAGDLVHIVHVSQSDTDTQTHSGNLVHVMHVLQSEADTQTHSEKPWMLMRRETKIKEAKISAIAKKIAPNWKWISNVSSTEKLISFLLEKARIIILWDSDMLNVQADFISSQHITCTVNSKDGRINCIFSSVYGHNHQDSRKFLWNELLQVHQITGNTHWLVCGDFNTMINNDEKLGGIALTDADTRGFNSFIEDNHLLHLKTEGCFFTWNNKQDQDSRVWCRLDRALVNDSWIQNYNSSHVEFLLPNFSDHSPALVSIYKEEKQGKKPFKFFNMWTNHSNYMSTVSSIWQRQVAGYKMFSIVTKLKLLRGALKELNKKHYGNISEQAVRAKYALEEIQKKLQEDPQKAKIHWSIKGDRCTSYFHSIIKANRHQNRILVLKNSLGERITEGGEIANELISYFKNLLGTAETALPPDLKIIKKGPCLNENQVSSLSLPVTKDEIKRAVFSMADNKSPGPDGYGASFFKSAWSTIGDEVILAVEEFFSTGKMLGTINSTSITLIPKVSCPNTPADFRPISCCNFLYKIISKILANRIQSVMGCLISEAQSAFVKGRHITNNILLAHELVKNYGRKHISPRIMVNIDIRKAFDTINWNFIKEMLQGLGFPKVIVSRIMTCITTPKYSLSLNGSLHGYFKGERGLRQGDPLSPYLFILGMEYLTRSLNLLEQDGNFKFHPKCGRQKISHLIFADDLLLFCKGDLNSVQKIHQCINRFSQVSGLQANPNKCAIFYGGVDDAIKESIQNYLGYTEGKMPIRYLGVPLVCKRLNYLDCNPLISKISSQLQNSLKNRKLSYAGRLQVIKSVILGIQIYWTSSYVLPVKVLQKVDKLCRNFLWGKGDLTFKQSLVSWDRVCTSKLYGGLGIFSINVLSSMGE
ncbi:uncharacterized protein LOC109835503 [Asparagus officinalis]|uniref:uncharacterized protein LOC109835503 n=1 Tax=Asparagus officinalis TaxID=4686 RepID=UPI00098E1B8E|nr:uncharacterized protein LOC109835503 [Asparagus officinalis]